VSRVDTDTSNIAAVSSRGHPQACTITTATRWFSDKPPAAAGNPGSTSGRRPVGTIGSGVADQP